MKRASRIVMVTLLTAFGCRPAENARVEKPEPVNVLLISIDTLRADRLNCYGYERRTISPNINALARDGVLFENYISASPWTTPAHMSLITSLYPSSHGVIESFIDMMTKMENGAGFNKLPDARQTITEVLRDAGFTTVAFTAGGTLDPRIGFDQGFEEYHVSMYKLRESNMAPMLDWLATHRDKSFFLFWHTFETHAPYIRPDFLPEVLPLETARAIGDGIRDIESRIPEGHPPLQEHFKNVRSLPDLLKQHDAFVLPVTQALYDGGVRHADRWVGQLVERLKAHDLYDRTVIIFTSDHGDEFGERTANHIYDAHGHSAYREIIRVPLIIKLPHQRHAGMRVPPVVRTIDVMPTILDVLEIDADVPEMQGESLRPLWEGDLEEAGRVAFTEGAARPYEVKSIRSDRYKYMVLVPEEVVKSRGRLYLPETLAMRGLYDMVEDPGEERNLLATPGVPPPEDVVTTLDQRLREFVETSQGVADRVELDPETLSRLRALGYVK